MPPADRDRAVPDADSDAALRRLEQRLQSASGAAQQLLEQALSEAATGGRKPPPAGFQRPAEGQAGDRQESEDDGGSGDLGRLLQIARELRELIPPELHLRLIEAFNELLLALRALIDWVLERQQRGSRAGAEVQDIPIL